jgi:3-oxoacyl-[acyl-carrier protein] reductase
MVMHLRRRLLAGKALNRARKLFSVWSDATRTERMFAAASELTALRALTGARVLITGSTRGIGRALAAGLVAHGARVAVHGRGQLDADSVARLIAEARGDPHCACGVAADLALPGAGRMLVSRAVDALGGLEIVINNAAIHEPERKPIWRTSSHEMQRVLAINVLAPFDVCSAAISSMIEQGIAGRIINISSGAADPARVSASGIASYGISKIALEGLSCYLAAEAAGIVVTTLRPGAIDTEMTASLFPRAECWQMLPPESLLPTVLHLLSAPAAEVHGQVFDQLALVRDLVARTADPLLEEH